MEKEEDCDRSRRDGQHGCERAMLVHYPPEHPERFKNEAELRYLRAIIYGVIAQLHK